MFRVPVPCSLESQLDNDVKLLLVLRVALFVIKALRSQLVPVITQNMYDVI